MQLVGKAHADRRGTAADQRSTVTKAVLNPPRQLASLRMLAARLHAHSCLTSPAVTHQCSSYGAPTWVPRQQDLQQAAQPRASHSMHSTRERVACGASRSTMSSSSREQTKWECSKCGARHSQWHGRCPTCKGYSCIEQVLVAAEPKGGGDGLAAARRALAGDGGGNKTMQNRVLQQQQQQQLVPVPVPAPAAAQVHDDYGAAGDDSSTGRGTGSNDDFPDYAALEAEADGYEYDSLFPDDSAQSSAAATRVPGSTPPFRQPAASSTSYSTAPSTSYAASQQQQGQQGGLHASGWVQAYDVPEKLSEIRREAAALRIPLPGRTGEEVARVLGGGLVPGALILIGGDPGVGKSTLLLQVAAMVARACSPAAAAADAVAARQQQQQQQQQQAPAAQAQDSEDDEDVPLMQRGRAAQSITASTNSTRHSNTTLGSNGSRSSSGNSSRGSSSDGGGSSSSSSSNGSVLNPVAPTPGLQRYMGRPVLYVTAEESKEQVWQRAQRMGLVHADTELHLLSDNRLDVVLKHIRDLWPVAVVVDSIQTVVLNDVDGRPGSLMQVRECATSLLQMARSLQTSIFLVGHVTKDGSIAGPKNLEHLVDAVLYLEGEQQLSYRLLRAVKNRHGRCGEVGIFTMRKEGLAAVEDVGDMFVRGGGGGDSSHVGSAITVVQEGIRPLMLEIQALVTEAPPRPAGPDGSPASGVPTPPHRTAIGLANRERLSMLLEVLSKHTPLRLVRPGVSIFLNVVAGYKIAASETATDLGVLAAVASSALDLPLRSRTAVVGEVGLAGELRSVKDLEVRLYEAAKLGFERVVVPAANRCELTPADLQGLQLVEVRTLREALDVLFGSDALPQRQERQQQYARQRQRRRSKTSAAAVREQREVESQDVAEDGGWITDGDDRGSGLSRLVPSSAMAVWD